MICNNIRKQPYKQYFLGPIHHPKTGLTPPCKTVQIWRPKIKTTTTTTMCQMLLHKPMTVYMAPIQRPIHHRHVQSVILIEEDNSVNGRKLI
jgi:hypothetical protein